MIFADSLLTLSIILILCRQGLSGLLDEACRPRLTPMILNGRDADPAPFMAFIMLDGKHQCGGSLISDRFVLTAKHCLMFNGNYTVRLGEYDTRIPEGEETFQIAGVIPHYDQNIDMILIKLEQKVEYKDHIRPICILVGSEERTLLNAENEFTLTGWGRISSKNPLLRPFILQQGYLTRIDPLECGKPYGYICAQDSQYACSGDSGGPLAVNVKYNHQTVYAQVGVLHGGENEKCNSFSTYADVAQFTDWIIGVIQNNNI